MKILIISFGFIDYTIQLANAISKKEKVALVLPDSISFPQKFRINKKVTLFLVNKPRARDLKNLLMILKIKKIIKQINPDIIHFQYFYPWFVFILPIIKKYKKITTIHDVICHPGEESFYWNFNSWMIRKIFDKVILHSKKLSELYIKKYNFSNKIYVIPHGNFEIYRSKKKFKEEHNWILFFGRIWDYKGLDYLIKAEPIIRKKIKDYKIIIAGIGENFDKYNIMIKNVNSFIIFNEFISEDKMIEIFQKSSVVVLPYIEASQSGVVPVAYQFKKPVIATDVGALSDVVKNYKTGILIKPKNVQILADAIVYLIKRPLLRKKMGIRGYYFAKNSLSWEKIAEMTIKAYKDETYN